MHLVAMLDGSRVDVTAHTAESWAALQESDDRKRLRMPICGIQAVAKTRGPSTRFFAHLSKKDCPTDHGGESPQHLAMKEALRRCIDQVPGWHGEIEYAHSSREWIIDVLAISDDRANRVAFEVQVSSQTPVNYFARSQRYFDSGAFPVWLVPRALEYHETKVPVVVTGFGKTSTIPEDVSELMSLPAGQDIVKAGDTLGAFVEALLRRGPSWKHGSPGDQIARQKAEADRAAVLAEAERKRLAAIEQSIAEMNDRSASPESAFGAQLVGTETQTFVWGALTACWSCEEPMLVWDARSPRPGKKWARVPDVDVKSEVDGTRFENHPEVHRVVDKWIKAAKADISKAGIRPRRTTASGRLYSAFFCPSCDSVMGQYFISRIRPEKWSILSGPAVVPASPRPDSANTSGPRPVGGGRLPRGMCDWCWNDPHPDYQCLWRRLRDNAEPGKHYSDGLYARISSGAVTEEEGTAAMQRMLDRVPPRP